MLKRLFIKKTIAQLQEEAFSDEQGLRRSLGALDLTMLGVGAIIGAGIFVLTGHAAAQYAGPAIVLSFLLAFVACGFAGLCYAELASMLPIAGSAYVYAYASMGEFMAWIIGWDLILEYFLGASAVSVGWSGYVVSFLANFGVIVPAYLSGPPVDFNPQTHVWILTGNYLNLPAALIVIIVTVFLVKGIKESAMFNLVIVVIKVSILLVFITVGLFHIKPELWHPFIPPNAGEFGVYGFSGIVRGAGVVFFAYIGFDTVSTAAQEARNPKRDLPIGILGSLFICTALYILVTLVMTGTVHYSKLNDPAPVAIAADAMNMHFFAPFVKIGAIAGLSSVVLVLLLGQSRIFYSMSRDGLLAPALSVVHVRYKTPYVATLLTCLLVVAASSLLPIGILGEMVSIGTLFAFFVVCAGVLILRFKNPEAKRHFKAPGGIFTPIGGMLSCLYLMYGLPGDTWLRLLVWLIIGLAIYFTYGIKKSRMRNA
jgi:APA family basic amino acid/polyamine antiporter